jgi:hypothetical protein
LPGALHHPATNPSNYFQIILRLEMNNTKHTPGPWKDFVNDDGYLIVQMDDAHTTVLGDMESTCGTCHANARLIAKAPEMLNQLERLVALAKWRALPQDKEEIEKAELLIAQINGEA